MPQRRTEAEVALVTCADERYLEPEVHDAARASILVLADPYTFPAAEFLEILNDKLAGYAA